MYAFGPLPRQKKSGRVIGTHQKIDRIAHRYMMEYVDPKLPFPSALHVLHFEGSRGPDAVKMKSPGKDEPWHFIDPKNINIDDVLLTSITNHGKNLKQALLEKNEERAAFEAAWLAHAVTDGLTPAHHDPLDEQTKDLKHSDDRRHTVRSKLVMRGDGSSKQFVKNNWKYWGAKGIMTTHTLFEAGVATTSKPLAFGDVTIETTGASSIVDFIAIYIDMVKRVDELAMYDQFKQKGWTRSLAQQSTKQLLPIIITAVTLAWYSAYSEALRDAT